MGRSRSTGERSPGIAPWLAALGAASDAGDEAGGEAGRARLVGGVAVALARRDGTRLPDLALLSRWGAPVPAELPDAAVGPALLGAVHQHLLARAARRRTGVFYTPAAMAATVAGWALDEAAVGRPVVLDPAAGGGAFLLAAADGLAARGVARADVVRHHLVGVDVDPVAAAVCEAALALWAGGAAPRPVAVADALALADTDLPARPDVVVGNPPFLNQLARATARGSDSARAARRRFGPAASGYVDTAGLFWLLALELAAAHGTVAMVLPRSLLATASAAALRRAVLADATLRRLWLPGGAAFDAAVRVCVPVLRRDGPRRAVVRRSGGDPPVDDGVIEVDHDELAVAPTWSRLLPGDGPAWGGGVLRRAGTLGDLAVVAADFRDQYYGMAPFVVDDVERALDDERFPRLVTSGLVDPAVCRWGARPARYHRRRWLAPRVDLDRLEAAGRLAGWARSRLVPKVLLATQTRVLEAAVDDEGRWLPSTPVISVVAPADELWRVAAVLSAPPVAAWAARTYGGAALSAGALKLRAADVREIPTPTDRAAWDEAADGVRAASAAPDDATRRDALVVAGSAACRAYGVEPGELLAWWVARLPRPR